MAGLDHVVHCTGNFDGLRTTMAQIGFTLTPPAEHPFGTGNSLVQLDGFFLEFLHLPNPHLVPKVADGEFGFAAHNADYMKDGGGGVSMLVFESSDAAAEQARFVSEGLDTYNTFDFSRLAKQPDGEEVTVGFSLAFATHADMGRVAFFYCQQHAPQYFWKPEYQRHANTAWASVRLPWLRLNPCTIQGSLRRLSHGEIVVSADNMVRIRTPRGELAMYSPAAFETAYGFAAPSLADGPVLAGYRIEVENREVALNQLDDAHVGMARDAIWPCHRAGCRIRRGHGVFRGFLTAMLDPKLTGMQNLERLRDAGGRAPLGSLMDFRLVDVGDGFAVFEGNPGAKHYNPAGTVHGGWISSILDSALGCAIHSRLEAGQGYTTVN